METSPLLHGQKTNTPLDLITERLYFVWPLSKRQIEWLNTVIYNRYPFWINYWSLTHFGWGVIWALLGSLSNQKGVFSLPGLLIFHTVFELWELWAGGYLSGAHILDVAEFVDIVMDTVFAVLGFLFLTVAFRIFWK